MEKIAIFDTTSVSPTPPIVTGAISFIYGTSANQTRILNSSSPTINNLLGGGSNAVASATDGSVQGNVFPCSYTIMSMFTISFGEFLENSLPVAQLILNFAILENGVAVETWNNVTCNQNQSNALTFNSIGQFNQNNAYSLRITGFTGTKQAVVYGWSVAVQFLSIV